MSYLQNFKFDVGGSDELGTKNGRLVFLHGLMGGAANWRKITGHFRKTYQTLAFDQRGHGRSFHPASGYQPSDYADDLYKILQELGWDRVHLVGHSMGGRNAMNFAARYPKMLTSLVIEDIGPQGTRRAMDRTLRLLDIVPAPFPDRAAAKSFFENDFPKLMPHHPQRAFLGSYLYTNMEEKSDGTADWRFQKDGIVESLRAGHENPRWDEFEKITTPTLLVRGELSDDLPEDEYKEMLRRNPHVRGVQIAGTGHWLHFEKSREFIRVLEEFWASFRNL